MRSPVWRILAALVLAAGLGLAGCSSHPTAPSAGPPAGSAKLDLNRPYGGLTATDDPSPATDPYFAAALAEDAGEDAADPVALAPEVAALERVAGQMPAGVAVPRFTFARIVWGVLDRPDTLAAIDPAVPTDWSGLVHVDRGILIVRRAISFERPGDHLVFPRPDRLTAAWVSHTGLGRDGLLIEVIEPPLRPGEPDTLPPNRLTFTTAPFQRAFALPELAGIDSTFAAGSAGDAIRFSGFAVLPLPACPEGFLAGLWTAPSDSGGTFKGRWLGVRGDLQGFLHGGWGYDSTGARVLVGKWITRSGAFRGLLHGGWNPAPEPGRGDFSGQWVNAAGMAEGVLRGQYMRPPRARVGLFSGLWASDCAPEAADQVR